MRNGGKRIAQKKNHQRADGQRYMTFETDTQRHRQT